MKRRIGWRWIVLMLLGMAGCATLPAQLEVSASHAVLEFPASMKLLAIDDQTFDTLIRVNTLRVRPGPHILRFEHLNAGADGSSAHAGQHAAPFPLDVQEGVMYRFESKT